MSLHCWYGHYTFIYCLLENWKNTPLPLEKKRILLFPCNTKAGLLNSRGKLHVEVSRFHCVRKVGKSTTSLKSIECDPITQQSSEAPKYWWSRSIAVLKITLGFLFSLSKRNNKCSYTAVLENHLLHFFDIGVWNNPFWWRVVHLGGEQRRWNSVCLKII